MNPQRPGGSVSEEFVTCAATYQTASWPTRGVTHRCTRPLPHINHACPCGTTWTTTSTESIVPDDVRSA
jgi:hypothetical protein